MNTPGSALKSGMPRPMLKHRRRAALTPARVGVYAFLLTAALFFLLPLYVMLVTSVKPMSEIRLGNLLAFPTHFTLQAWSAAWQSACTGLDCNGIQVGFWNSVRIVVPSTVFSIAIGA
ncbi:MAG: carbohydrate ABC transporter permease, partial [Burkholderia sp.]|nr:carbohydrate ABC transporter permease [Burkholderia sp.]